MSLRMTSVLSDVVEAIVAALYLDGGLDPVRRFVLANWTLDAEARCQGARRTPNRVSRNSPCNKYGTPTSAYRMVSIGTGFTVSCEH